MPNDEPIFQLPPYTVEQILVSVKSETIDWGLMIFGIPSLWDFSQGEGVKVAVLDTGAALQHPDLKGNILMAADFTGSSSGANDQQGHGTHCAGIIAGIRNNTGVAGVAPKASLMIGKVLGDNGSGSSDSVSKGIKWAADNGAHIISMSLGSSQSSPDIHSAIKYAYSKGCYIIAAAGNEGPGPNTVGYPGQYPEVIAVASINSSKKLSNFSSRGNQVDIAAPGEKILSCYPPKNLAVLSGTSMATPFVAGVVALLLSKRKKTGEPIPANNNEMLKLLAASAIDVGKPGVDSDFGYGIIDPVKLINTVNSPAAPLPSLSLTASDFSAAGLEKMKSFVTSNTLVKATVELVGGSGSLSIKL